MSIAAKLKELKNELDFKLSTYYTGINRYIKLYISPALQHRMDSLKKDSVRTDSVKNSLMMKKRLLMERKNK